MFVFTLATPGDYERMTAFTAPTVSRATGYACNVLTLDPSCEPFEAKLDLLSRVREPSLFVDADVVMHDWDWSLVDAERVNAFHAPYRTAERRHKPLLPDPHVLLHTGVVFMPPERRHAAALALDLMRGELRGLPMSCHDELPFSVACARLGAPANLLPSEALTITNHTTLKPARAVHFFDGDARSKLTRIRQYLERNNL